MESFLFAVVAVSLLWSVFAFSSPPEDDVKSRVFIVDTPAILYHCLRFGEIQNEARVCVYTPRVNELHTNGCNE